MKLNSIIKHPIIVSSFSLLFAGFILQYLQADYLKKQNLLSKRFEVIEEITKYSNSGMSILRYYQGVNKAVFNRNNMDNEVYISKVIDFNVKIQVLLNDQYELSHTIKSHINLFFNNPKILDQFMDLKNEQIKAIDYVNNNAPKRQFDTADLQDYANILTTKTSILLKLIKEDINL